MPSTPIRAPVASTIGVSMVSSNTSRPSAAKPTTLRRPPHGRRQSPPGRAADGLGALRREQIGIATADDLAFGQAEETLAHRVAREVAALRIFQPDQVGQGVDQRFWPARSC